MIEDVWKRVPDFEDYEVNAQGQIRSLRLKRDNPKILKPWIDTDGYLNVTIRKPGTRAVFKRKLHHLILTSFGNPRVPGMETAHLNGIRSDNRLVNLRWVTPKINQSHRIYHDTHLRGSRAKKSRLKEEDIPKILLMRKSGWTLSGIAKIFQVDDSTIKNVVYGSTWTWFSRVQYIS